MLAVTRMDERTCVDKSNFKRSAHKEDHSSEGKLRRARILTTVLDLSRNFSRRAFTNRKNGYQLKEAGEKDGSQSAEKR